MTTKHYRAALAVSALLWGGLLAAPAGACDVPVFRYALERWLPSPYGVLVFHRGELSEADQKVVDWLKEAPGSEEAPCNVDVYTADVAGKMEPPIAEIWKTMGDPNLPHMAAFFPRRYGPLVQAWAGPLNAANVQALVDSPVRREVVRRIVKGDCAVWVLLESGQKDKDDAAAKLLESELKRLEGLLELPMPVADWPGAEEEDGPGGPPALKLAFSVVRLSRSAADEKALVHMLLHTEEDLAKEYASEPMAFAVFGQGRAMFALVGKGINADNIEEVCGFLVSRCSCEIKDMNPGVDLLMTANWYAAFEQDQQAVPELPALIGGPAPVSEANSAETAVPRVAAVAARDFGVERSPLLRNVLIAFGFLALAAVGLVVWLNRRPARS